MSHFREVAIIYAHSNIQVSWVQTEDLFPFHGDLSFLE